MVVGCFLLFLLFKKQPWKNRFLWAGFALLIFFSNDFISNRIMNAWEVDAIPFDQMKPHELAIVLTGATQSLVEPNDRVYFHRGADRVTHTIQLYRLGLIKKILISGGSGLLLFEEEPEANKFKKVMVMSGVPEHDIILENRTRNTGESSVAVKKMIDSLQYKPEDCLLVTSAFHMRRSLACYRKVGLDIQPFSTDFYGQRRPFFIGTLFLPTIQGFIIWEKLFKEWSGLVAYKLAGYV
jgi:uncharacterized SAM-binding protein YcdF (DUF218 family)